MKCTIYYILNIAFFFLLAITPLICESASAAEAERDIHAEDSLAEKILLKTFPAKYWRKRIKDLEEQIAYERSSIRDMGYDLEILTSTAAIEVKKAAHWASSAGDDPRVAAVGRREEIRRDIHDLKMDIAEERLYLQRDLEWLEIAKRKLENEVGINKTTTSSQQTTKALEQKRSAPGSYRSTDFDDIFGVDTSQPAQPSAASGYRDPELDKIFGIKPDGPSSSRRTTDFDDIFGVKPNDR